MRAIKLLALFIFSCSTLLLNAQSDWQLKKNVDGIKVYLRPSVHGEVKELRMDLEVEASLSTIIAVMNDVPAHKEWVYGTCDAREIRRINDHEMVYYNRTDFPWPMSDRELVVHSKLWQDPATRIVYTESVAIQDNTVPTMKDVIRISKSKVTWKMTPISPTKTRLEYYLGSDPAGSIPAWLTNMALDYGPIQTMQTFRKRLKLEKYNNAYYPLIQEFELAKK